MICLGICVLCIYDMFRYMCILDMFRYMRILDMFRYRCIDDMFIDYMFWYRCIV